MDLGLLGKTAVITGGSKGIGFAIAEEFAREGVDLHLSARSGDDLRRAAADLTARFGIRVDIHAVDLSDRAARDAFARECAHVDILVNCAGAITAAASVRWARTPGVRPGTSSCSDMSGSRASCTRRCAAAGAASSS